MAVAEQRKTNYEHGLQMVSVLQGKGIKPHRPLEKDLELTDQAMSYDGSATKRATMEVRNNPLANKGKVESGKQKSEIPTAGWPRLTDGKPDFDQMTAGQLDDRDDPATDGGHHLLAEFVDGRFDYRITGIRGNIPYFVMAAWTAKQISFPRGFAQTEEGRRYLAQLYAFRGKRSPSAPARICAAPTGSLPRIAGTDTRWPRAPTPGG